MAICIYPPMAEDFTTNGLGILTPLECTVEETAAGKYELELVQPIDNTLRWAQIANGCIVKVPVPVRESPLYEAPAMGEPVTVTRQVWQVYGTSHGLYLRSGPGMSYKRIGKRYNGDEIIELEDAPDPWKKVCVADSGAVGYMSTKYLKPIRTITEVIEPAKPTGGSALMIGQAREQLFRIYSVEQDSEAATVTAKALHVFYDENGNLINDEYEIEEGKTEEVNAVMANIDSKLAVPHTVRFQAINLTGDITGDFGYKTPVEAYLDPDDGVVSQTKALLVRDNWEAYLLPDMVRDRGVTIRRGKNLIGVEVTNDASSIVTRIIPVGKDKDGDPLYLKDEKWIDSPRINDYPFPRIKRIEYDVQTGKDDFKNDTAVRNEIKRLAEEDFSKNGVDLPKYGMEVDFVLLQNTAEYADFASLQAVHLYDTVTVIDEMLGLNAKVRVTGYTWNCLTKQYEKVTLGELQDVKQTVYSYNLPNAGVSGSKIMNNSLGGSALRSASIEYAKISVAAIEQLSASAIIALTARIQEIVAQKLTTDELYAAYAEMIALKVGTITADNIMTDSLAAELARITVLAAGTATFDKATIQHLVAAAMNLEYGVAGQVFIKNLAVEYAQMVGATIGELCIKASDGNYYLLDVGADGTVSATKTTVSNAEAAAGQTSGGKVILETNITAANLNAGNLLATYALINQIDAARIDVDQLFAREAFVTALTTSQIFGGQSLEVLVERNSKNYRSEEMPSGDVKVGDTWVIPSLAVMYQAEDANALNVKFYLDDDGSLYYEADTEDDIFEVQDYDLYSEDIALNMGEDGKIDSVTRWRIVTDLSGIEAVQDDMYQQQLKLKEEQDKVATCLIIDPDMVRICKPGSASEVQINNVAMGVAVNGKIFSRFEAQRAVFGNMEIRRPNRGGLVFDSIDEEVSVFGYRV